MVSDARKQRTDRAIHRPLSGLFPGNRGPAGCSKAPTSLPRLRRRLRSSNQRLSPTPGTKLKRSPATGGIVLFFGPLPLGMLMSSACDGFRLAYERQGLGGQSVILLHGWPGDHTDFRYVVPLLTNDVDVVVPDLRGFGFSDKHRVDPSDGYSAAAQAHSIATLITELRLDRPVVAGYDIGGRIAQTLAREHPGLIKALVLSPSMPGIGDRVLDQRLQRRFWYQAFHQLSLPDELIDGNPNAVRSYLRHFWTHWSDPTFSIADEDLDHLVAVYSPPGAFTASIAAMRRSKRSWRSSEHRSGGCQTSEGPPGVRRCGSG